MSTSRVDTLPAVWNDARDIPFFRITARLLTPEFCLGAGVLLASYDDDVRGDTRTTAPVTTGVPEHDRDLSCPSNSRRSQGTSFVQPAGNSAEEGRYGKTDARRTAP